MMDRTGLRSVRAGRLSALVGGLVLLLVQALVLNPHPAWAGQAADKMAEREEAVQREILGIEIRSSGNRCHAVDRMMYMGEFRNRDAYSANCVDGFDYLVLMRYRGQLYGAGVRVCRVVEYNFGFPCWQRIPGPGPARHRG